MHAVEKIRIIKKRAMQPFSVIAPSKDWIKENCIINDKKWLDKLPGPYTLVLKLQNNKALSDMVNPDIDTVGVRIPKNWFSEFISETGVPIITTSVNKSGEEFMTTLENLDDDIRHAVDFIIYEGEKTGSPSTIVRLDKEKPEILERRK